MDNPDQSMAIDAGRRPGKNRIPFQAYWDLLAAYLRPQRGRFILLAVLMLVSIGLQLVNPLILRGFIDAALAGAAVTQLVLAGLAFLGIALLYQGVSIAVRYLGELVAWTATNDLRADLAWHTLNLDMGYFGQHTPGELIERIDGDVAELAKFFSEFFILLIGNLLLMAGIVVVLFFQDWRIGLGFSLFAGLSVWLLGRMRTIAVDDQKGYRQATADLFGFIEEQMAGAEDIRANGAIDYSLRGVHQRMAQVLHWDRRSHFKRWQIELVINLLLTGGMLLAVASGYRLYLAGAITVGTVYLIVYYINMLETPIWVLTHEVETFQTIGACVERLTELRQQSAQVQDGPQTLVGDGAVELAFDQVSFAYQEDEPVLAGLSFSLGGGAHLGLLGRTGSGKTTLARLIFRLYDPLEGAIRLDGSDLRSARLADLRRRVGMVTQEVQLFRATIRQNLTFFDDSISDERIHTAIAALELSDWYANLPAGLDTLLESGGHSLSAGEAQLLAFTRIFLRDPGLVILDEASSRLDPATEQRIERAVQHLLEGRTAIIIAHRLHTVERVDQVMILEGGRVSEYGERQALASDPNSQFARLLRTGMEEVLA
jgi:ABC-type multidrug transport system fused ATPase/permease subunit